MELFVQRFIGKNVIGNARGKQYQQDFQPHLRHYRQATIEQSNPNQRYRYDFHS